MRPIIISASLLVLARAAGADVYYVCPQGSDANDGRSPEKAWRSVAKVNGAAFLPGDQILFARGGEWRESLKASSSGEAGRPIVYGAYGTGAKPRFWGSDLLRISDSGTAPCPVKPGAVLADHQFLLPAAWTWEGGTVTVGRDVRAGKREWTACVRVDLVHSNGKNHLVFRDLAADESADARDGYGFRVMGSDGVRLENCEAYRAGRHHFGVINSTNFVGTKLHCAWAVPQCPGGSTFYVSFSDPSRKGDTHQWIDCSAEHFDNPGGANYQVFYDHGEGLGPILVKNLTSKGGKFSVGSSAAAPVTIEGGSVEDNSLEIFGDHCRVSGLTIRGNGGVDHFGSDSLFENLLLVLAPRGGGPTGYGAGFLFRDGAKRNAVRFCTVLLEGDNAVQILGRGSETKVTASVLCSRKKAIEGEAAATDQNFSEGDPRLGPDGVPKPGSPVIGAAKIDPSARPATDLKGKKRPPTPSIGAFEP